MIRILDLLMSRFFVFPTTVPAGLLLHPFSYCKLGNDWARLGKGECHMRYVFILRSFAFLLLI